MIDIIKKDEKLWELFCRKEEYDAQYLDNRQRFSSAHAAFKNLQHPVVSEFLRKNNWVFPWRDDKKFTVCLSHDIDDIYPTVQYRYFTSLKLLCESNVQAAMKRIRKKENPYQNFKEIMHIEKEADAVSTFYIMADNSRYNPKELSEDLQYVIDNGGEIGLHGGYSSYNDAHKLRIEKQALEEIIGKNVIGYRNHHLRFKVPDTWILLSKIGFQYDSTMGYPSDVGFRNGMCHPFSPFNVNENTPIDIIEIPLVAIDNTLFRTQNVTEEERWGMCKNLIDTVERLNGMITFLWHNYSFDSSFYKNRRKLYTKILSYCHQKNAWITSSKEVCEWTKKNLRYC